MRRPVVQDLAARALVPAKRARRRVGPAHQRLADELDAVVDVVPLAVVDGAVRAHDGRVVPLRVEGLAERVEAVQLVEDGNGDEVLVFPRLERDGQRHVREFLGLFLGDADVGAIYVCGP